MSELPPLEIARRYLAALSSGADSIELESFYDTGVVQEEFPNRLLPNGATRTLDDILQARARGKALLAAESFEIRNALGSGSDVAMELVWRATVDADAGPFRAGQQLTARFAMFLEFRDGRIVRQRNYDCFDPW